MYLDTGSGAAADPSPAEMIAAVRAAVPCPVIVGGGMTTPDAVMDAWAAGADLAVVGSAIERDPQFLQAFAAQGHPGRAPRLTGPAEHQVTPPQPSTRNLSTCTSGARLMCRPAWG